MNLAVRMRPETLQEFVGQSHILGEGKIIRRLIEQHALFSMILWGPPGSGKTTLAHIIAHESDAAFYTLSGVSSGKADLQDVLKKAEENKKIDKKSILFIDEIHRWNKAQQDALLPFVENGTIILIGATTENPSFEVISALLSRCKVFVLQGLSEQALDVLISRAVTDIEKGLGKYKKTVPQDVRKLLIRYSGGDARILLNALELAASAYKAKTITTEIIEAIFQKKSAGLYDKKADEHYNTISAFIKSMRASDIDASLYYMVRMLEGGEDPKFIARRMIIFAAEDVGLADRGALVQANACFDAIHKIGMPEAAIILSYTTIYLAKAPKSRSAVNALGKAKELVYTYPNAVIPLHLRNAPTTLMKELEYAKDYSWSKDFVGQSESTSFLPEELKGKKIFES